MKSKLLFCFIVTLLISFKINATTLNLQVKGNHITFVNAVANGPSGSYILSNWQSISNLTPTRRWQPGIPTTSATQFELTGPGGSISVPIKLIGLEYNLGSASVTGNDTLLVPGTMCGPSEIQSGSLISFWIDPKNVNVPGPTTENCTTTVSYQSNESQQPFYFVRPIFHIDESGLIDAFSKLSDPIKGRYTGSIPVSLKYYYKDNLATTYRIVPMSHFSVQIHYQPDLLTEIRSETQKEIQPIYNTSSHTVSGEAVFNIQARGYFQSGIKMSFINRDYSMVQVVDNSDANNLVYGKSKIPYYIRCLRCNVVKIVENGVLLPNARNPVEYNVVGPVTNLEFDLSIGYENLKSEDVGTGFYMDTFTVMFEEIL
ncbi:hypothetical protein [Photobacterium sp. 1_MG-2023]|uniref:hypothetical protein n=1 Tax=Photobacterium sp. 1_MG-2023 TaxID=3062646 RepID=UPI0026E1A170|nr:hypothetical protein [Photobacterium sp. 1_MG-2023]MDO6708807.1 hypothetical protein [Photobacterium sp. 1_MG-2023]